MMGDKHWKHITELLQPTKRLFPIKDTDRIRPPAVWVEEYRRFGPTLAPFKIVNIFHREEYGIVLDVFFEKLGGLAISMINAHPALQIYQRLGGIVVLVLPSTDVPSLQC